MGFHHVGQAGLELQTSRSTLLGLPKWSHHAWPQTNFYSEKPLISSSSPPDFQGLLEALLA